MMSYTNQEFAYDADRISDHEVDDGDIGGRRKDYTRGRSYKPTRRRSRRRSNHPGCGIAGRRNRRYDW